MFFDAFSLSWMQLGQPQATHEQGVEHSSEMVIASYWDV